LRVVWGCSGECWWTQWTLSAVERQETRPVGKTYQQWEGKAVTSSVSLRNDARATPHRHRHLCVVGTRSWRGTARGSADDGTAPRNGRWRSIPPPGWGCGGRGGRARRCATCDAPTPNYGTDTWCGGERCWGAREDGRQKDVSRTRTDRRRGRDERGRCRLSHLRWLAPLWLLTTLLLLLPPPPPPPDTAAFLCRCTEAVFLRKNADTSWLGKSLGRDGVRVPL